MKFWEAIGGWIVGPCGPEFWVNRYQTAWVGLLAVGAAWLGYRAALDQLSLATGQDKRTKYTTQLEKIAKLRALSTLIAACGSELGASYVTIGKKAREAGADQSAVKIAGEEVRAAYEAALERLRTEGFALIEQNFISREIVQDLKRVLTAPGWGGHPPQPPYNPEEITHGPPGQYLNTVMFTLEQGERDFRIKARDVQALLDPAAEIAMTAIEGA